jgi:hypothetical protein
MENDMAIPTTEEIGKRFEAKRKRDLLGFETDMYAEYMTYEQIKPYAKDDLTEELWGEVPTPNMDGLIEEMREYMPFAFEKAYGKRGISANRSIMHFIAWIWLTGNVAFSTEIEEEYERNYHSYGLPVLIKICKYYGFDVPVRV